MNILINGIRTLEFYCHIHLVWNHYSEDCCCFESNVVPEKYYCEIHGEWNFSDDEGNCCEIEREESGKYEKN